jgi:hypothetical protein
MKRIIPAVLLLAIVGSDAAAERPYASPGTSELGGLAELSFSKQSFTPEGFDESVEDTSTTILSLQPVYGYFLAPGLQIIAGPTVSWIRETPDEDDEDSDDVTATGLGARVGAGYYIPSGPIFVGPRAQVGYEHLSIEAGDVELSANNWLFQAAGALRVPFGGGGLLDLALVVDYLIGSTETDVVGMPVDVDTTNLSVGLQAGFFVYF